jgi:hypothetical protein
MYNSPSCFFFPLAQGPVRACIESAAYSFSTAIYHHCHFIATLYVYYSHLDPMIDDTSQAIAAHIESFNEHFTF